MKEQYQKEMSRIHVPTKILEKTKLVMKEEEKKGQSEKSGKILFFPKISLATAAAVLLLIMIPAASERLNHTDEEAVSDERVQLYLDGKEKVELQEIKQDKNWFEELIDAIQDYFD